MSNADGKSLVIARVVAVLQKFNEIGLGLPEALAFLWVAGKTMQMDNPRLPIIKEIQTELGMKTISGASRVLAKLASDFGLLQSDRGIRGARAEAYFLSHKGRSLVAEIVNEINSSREYDVQSHELSSYAKARFIEGVKSTSLSITKLDDAGLICEIMLDDTALKSEVLSWSHDNLSPETKIELRESGFVIEFADMSDAVYFRLRW
ncbi:hypothetical protein [Methylobacterium oryzisoli]